MEENERKPKAPAGTEMRKPPEQSEKGDAAEGAPVQGKDRFATPSWLSASSRTQPAKLKIRSVSSGREADIPKREPEKPKAQTETEDSERMIRSAEWNTRTSTLKIRPVASKAKPAEPDEPIENPKVRATATEKKPAVTEKKPAAPEKKPAAPGRTVSAPARKPAPTKTQSGTIKPAPAASEQQPTKQKQGSAESDKPSAKPKIRTTEPMNTVPKKPSAPAGERVSASERKPARPQPETPKQQQRMPKQRPAAEEPAEKRKTPLQKTTPAASEKKPAASQSEPETPDTPSERPKKRKSDLLYAAYGLLIKLGWIALSVFILLMFVVGIHRNVGVNMEPSFHDRDVVLYNRLAKNYKAGDVVVFKRENGSAQIGRIIARSGDVVEITDGGVKLNGYYQTETNTKGETVRFEGAVTFPMTLGKGEYFILFDNRLQGGDSRTLGKISSGEIKGHVIFAVRARDF